MTTVVANPRAQKRKLLDRLQENADSNERDEIERQLAQISVALDYLDPTGRMMNAADRRRS